MDLQRLSQQRLEERYCAFLDILGFKSLLEEIEKEPSNESRIKPLISALNFISEETQEPHYGSDLPVYELGEGGCLIEKELGDLKMTYVSDCLIISSEHSSDGLKALCRKITKIWIDLAWDGYFCRGAVTSGLLFHHRDIVFGSAYMRAYELESSCAKMPRVIFDTHVISDLGGFPAQFPIRPPTACQSNDGWVYLRYFPYYFFPPYSYDWSNYLLKIRHHLALCIQKTEGSLRQKYIFLADEFNFTVNEYHEFLDPSVLPLET